MHDKNVFNKTITRITVNKLYIIFFIKINHFILVINPT